MFFRKMKIHEVNWDHIVKLAIDILAISCLLTMFFPYFEIKIFKVGMVHLDRVEVEMHYYSLFASAFGNTNNVIDCWFSIVIIVFAFTISGLLIWINHSKFKNKFYYMIILSIISFVFMLISTKLLLFIQGVKPFEYTDNLVNFGYDYFDKYLTNTHLEKYAAWFNISYGMQIYLAIFFIISTVLIIAKIDSKRLDDGVFIMKKNYFYKRINI